MVMFNSYVELPEENHHTGEIYLEPSFATIAVMTNNNTQKVNLTLPYIWWQNHSIRDVKAPESESLFAVCLKSDTLLCIYRYLDKDRDTDTDTDTDIDIDIEWYR